MYGRCLKELYLPSGETKVQYPYCTTMIKLSKTSSTTTLKRHLQSCKKHPRTEKEQKENQLATTHEDETKIIVINFKYDKEMTRKVFVDIIIVDEKPFRNVEQLS